jgi:hypothetical protein
MAYCLRVVGWVILTAGLVGSGEGAIATPPLYPTCPTSTLEQAEFPALVCAPVPSLFLSQAQRVDATPLEATPVPAPDDPLTEAELAPLELDPAIIEQSPVLRRWLENTPDIADEIRNQPSFRTRLRVGYVNFPSSGDLSGFGAGVEDVFLIPGTGLTASGDYSRSSNGQRESYGAQARYYLLPLGGYVNLAPSLGYRSVSTPAYSTDGLDIGLRLMVIPSRGGAADLAISQHWVSPGGENEIGITSFALGYAVTRQLRLGTDLQFQNSRFGQDSRWGLSLEWLL